MNEIIHIPQSSYIKITPNEIELFSEIFKNEGISLECIDYQQYIVHFPQAYVGYISLPNRKIIIDPKHEGIDLRHIIRIFYFLYASDNYDLDDPIYEIDKGSSFDIIDNFIKELDKVIKRGLPVDYIETTEDLQFLRGNLDIIRTSINFQLKRREVFNCLYDDLSYDISLNRILYKALLKISQISNSPKIEMLHRHFLGVSESFNLSKVVLNTNNLYCKKALTLAYMILNDMTVSNFGNQGYGQNLLLNFDKLFEDFVKRILTVWLCS